MKGIRPKNIFTLIFIKLDGLLGLALNSYIKPGSGSCTLFAGITRADCPPDNSETRIILGSHARGGLGTQKASRPSFATTPSNTANIFRAESGHENM